MYKKWFCGILAVILLISLAACGRNDTPEETVHEIEHHQMVASPMGLELFEQPESTTLPGRIAIITGIPQTWRSGASERNLLVSQLMDRYGSGNIRHFMHSQFAWLPEEQAYLLSVMEEIAQDSETKVVIFSPAALGTDYAASWLREQRDDIFIIFLEHNTRTFGGIDAHINNTVSRGAAIADLVLNINMEALNQMIPVQAQRLGAETIVFLDIYPEELERYGIEDFHAVSRDLMRAAAQEIGLNFVEVFRSEYVVQCGSSAHMYLYETLPGIIEEHGRDIVLIGLGDERMFWETMSYGTIFPSHVTMTPSPFDIVDWLFVPSVDTMHMDFHSKYNIRHIIEETRKTLEEIGMLGRVSTWPVSVSMMLTYAAVEYGIMWMNGEVPQEGIDTAVLGRIMVDFIAEYSGEVGLGVTFTPLWDDGTAHLHYIQVFMDYLTY